MRSLAQELADLATDLVRQEKSVVEGIAEIRRLHPNVSLEIAKMMMLAAEGRDVWNEQQELARSLKTLSEVHWKVAKVDGPEDETGPCAGVVGPEPGQKCGAPGTGWRQGMGRKIYFCASCGRHANLSPLTKRPVLSVVGLSDENLPIVLEAKDPSEMRLLLERHLNLLDKRDILWLSFEIDRVWNAP